MHRPLLCIVSALLLSACGGGQKGPRGPVFCESYEVNYLESCLQQCEAELELTDTKGRDACQSSCKEDLADDDTWTEDCVK